MTNRQTIQELTDQLRSIRLAAENIKQTIQLLQEEAENPRDDDRAQPAAEQELRGPPTNPPTRDRDNQLIHYNDKIIFLTRGLYNSTTGRVYRVARNGNTVTARDDQGRSISRQPQNVRILRR